MISPEELRHFRRDFPSLTALPEYSISLPEGMRGKDKAGVYNEFYRLFGLLRKDVVENTRDVRVIRSVLLKAKQEDPLLSFGINEIMRKLRL